MNINTKVTNMELTDSVKDYVYKKLEGLEILVDSDDSEAQGQVELGKTTNHHKQGDIFRAEINLTYNGKQVRAVSETEDLYNSIDQMRDEVFREVKKQKGRERSLVRRGGKRVKDMMRGVWRFGRNK
jgi:ribosomal subunit interface protein